MNGKTLKLGDPILSTWPNYNFIISFIRDKDTHYDWIMNNLVNVVGIEHHYLGCERFNMNFTVLEVMSWNPSIFDVCPFVELYKYPKKLLYDDIVNFVIDSIDNDFAVALELNQFFRYEQKEDYTFIHKSFVYGYDKKREVFLLMDHFNNGKFNKLELAFNTFVEACDRTENFEINTHSRPDLVYLLKSKEYAYSFDKMRLKMHLENFLASNKTLIELEMAQKQPFKINYGMSSFEKILQYIEHAEDFLDARVFSFLHDYARLTLFRVQYLHTKKIVSDEKMMLNSKFILDSANIALQLCIKYNINNQYQSKVKIQNCVNQIIDALRNISERLIDII